MKSVVPSVLCIAIFCMAIYLPSVVTADSITSEDDDGLTYIDIYSDVASSHAVVLLNEDSKYSKESLNFQISEHIPTLSLNKNVFSENKNLNYAFDINADSFGYYFDASSNAYCFDATGFSEKETLQLFTSWFNKIPTVKSASQSNDYITNNFVSAGTTVVSHYYNTDRGKLNVNVLYTEQSVGESQYRYFVTEYKIQSVPNDHRRTADISVECDFDEFNSKHKLLTYDPTTSSGQTTYSVDMSWGYETGTSGASVSGTSSYGWSYSVSDIQIKDQSDLSLQLFKSWHDVNQDHNVGRYSLLIRPGCVSQTDISDNNGAYHVHEKYGVDFCKYGKHHSFSKICYDFNWYYYTAEVNIN